MAWMYIWAPPILRLFVLVAVLGILLRAYRSIAERSRWAGRLVASGLVGRAVLGFGLFFLSYLDLPVVPDLHSGDGFWKLAPDARLYFDLARQAAANGPWTVQASAPSPAFVTALSSWMWLVGVSPAAGALLNICCYVLVCWLMVRLLEHDRTAALVGVAAFTLSPALLVFGSQPLKDGLFAAVVACICVGVWRILAAPQGGVPFRRELLTATVLILAGLSMVAGIRTYYALFLWGALALVLLGLTVAAGRPGIGKRAGAAALLLSLAWVAVSTSAGARPDTVVSQAAFRGASPGGETPSPYDAIGAFDEARRRFISSGGNTNLSGPARTDGLAGRVTAVGFGLLLVFVPLTPLDWLGLAQLPGRRALIALADLDTLFVDLSLLAVSLVVWRRWRSRRLNVPYALFIAAVALPTAVALAYVVTNFGTLFRLRLMVAVPVWMLTLAAQEGMASKQAAGTSSGTAHV